VPKIERALISLSDKTGIEEFSKELASFGIKFLSTGGTAKVLREQGLDVVDVSDYTRFPEIMDGRVKTLHPKVHGGLLGLRSNPEHLQLMKQHDIKNIDMVIVNLYPFEKTIAKIDSTFEEAIENIDIGGPTMLRSAAKNFSDVTVIVDPLDYQLVLDDLKKNEGSVSKDVNFYLAVKVFELTSKYDQIIFNYLQDKKNNLS